MSSKPGAGHNALYRLSLVKHNVRLHGHRIAKFGTHSDVGIFEKLRNAGDQVASLTGPSRHVLYYQEACRYWVKACKGIPFFKRNGERMTPAHGRTISFVTSDACAFVTCLMNSSLFYWFYSAFSDCEHINDALIRTFRIPTTWSNERWADYQNRSKQSLDENASRKKIHTKQGHVIEYDELNAAKSKPVFDEIDQALARVYGFSEIELDLIINYDIKYRLSSDGDDLEGLN